VREPPKVLGQPTVVLVLRTLDNRVDVHNHSTSSVTVSSSFCPRALHPSRRYYIISEKRISGSKLQQLNLHSSNIYIEYYYYYNTRVLWVHKVLLLQTRLHCWSSSLGTTFEQKQQNSVVSSPTTTWVWKPWVRSVLSQVLPDKRKDSQGYAGLRESR
jgi:hypothetical protein